MACFQLVYGVCCRLETSHFSVTPSIQCSLCAACSEPVFLQLRHRKAQKQQPGTQALPPVDGEIYLGVTVRQLVPAEGHRFSSARGDWRRPGGQVLRGEKKDSLF